MDQEQPAYRFMTTADWPDMESFRAALYDSEMQADLQESAADAQRSALLSVGEILVQESK